MTCKYFGTDGIRGRVGEPPITADFMLRLGRAAGRTLGNGRRRSVVIGKDTRISGYMFESALEAGLAAAGADILLLGPMPTPAVAHLTRSLGAAAGIVISASHNPFEDNGVKFFGPDGRKLSENLEQAMETEIDAPFDQVPSDRLGRASRIDDAAGRYIEFCKSAVPFGTSLRGLRLVVDCAHGATYRVAPEVLRELGASVSVIGNQPDGMNINLDCGSTRPRALVEQVRARGADAGIALDGDGDRAILVDAQGRIIDGDRILYILACARQEAGELGGGVVGTVMSNFGLEQALKSLGIPFRRAAVGDRHVHEMLVEQGWILGGETSGHILTLDRTTTGDGIVSAVQVLARMAMTGKTLAELAGGMRHYPQVMINVPVNGNARNALDGSAEISNAVAVAESELAGRGRVILRASGTEPLVRVTVEGHDEAQVRHLAEGLAEVVAAETGDADTNAAL